MPEPWEEYTATQEAAPWEEFGQTAVAEPPEPSDLFDAQLSAAPQRAAPGFFRMLGRQTVAPLKAAKKGLDLPLSTDDELKDYLERKFLESKGEKEPTTMGKVGGFIGGLLGTIGEAVVGSGAAMPGITATFASQSGHDAFVNAGVKALAEGKSIDEALNIAKGIGPIGATFGAATTLAFPAKAATSFAQAGKQGLPLGAAGAAGQLLENIAERQLGLKTPVLENVPTAGLTMAALPIGQYAVGRGLRAIRGRPVTEPTIPTERPADAIHGKTEEVLRSVRPQPEKGVREVPVSGTIETAAVRGEPVEAKAGEVTPTEGRAVLGDVAVDPATGKIPVSETQNFISRLGNILEEPKSDLSSERAFLLGDKFPVDKLDELRQYRDQVSAYVASKASERGKPPSFQERNRLARLTMFVNEVIQGSEKPADRPIIQETIDRAKAKEKPVEAKSTAVPEPKPAESPSAKPKIPPELDTVIKGLMSQKSPGEIWIYHGEGGPEGGGLGGARWSSNPAEALSYGPRMSAIKIPVKEAEKYHLTGGSGQEYKLPNEWIKQSRDLGTFERPAIELEAPKPAEPTPVIEPAKPTPEVPKPEPAKAAEPMRVGPGAMTAGEIESRARVQGDRAAAGEIPPGNNPPVTTDGSLTPNIEVSRANRDMNILNNLNTAQWTFWLGRLGQAAKSAIERIFLGEFRMRESINRDVTSYVDATISSLPIPLRSKGGQAFFDVLDGRTMDQITAEWQGRRGGEAVIAGAQKVKGRLEEIRATIRDTKRDSFRGYLNGMDRPFVEDLFKKNIDPNIDSSTMTKGAMADALTLNEFPDTWGIADGTYLPHLFMGNYKVTADIPGLGFVTRAKTLAEAKARIYELVKNNPDYASANFVIEQDTVVPADMIRLGDRQFWTFVGKMKDALQTTPAEIRQAQQGIIGRKAAKQKWFGSLQQRLGFGGYERNFKRVMGAYLNGFHRWKELSSMQRDVQPMIDQVHKEGRFEAEKGLNDIIDFLWGKPARSTLQFDNFVRNIPGARDWIKPLALDRWSRNARTIISNLTLRTLRFATINRLQPLQGLYPLVGEKILLQGKKLQHTAEGRALLDEAGIRLDPGQYAEAGRMTKFGALMQRFSGEQSNQEWAFLSMYLHGTQQGMGKAQAIEYAKLRGQLMTQFTPLVSDIPPALRGPGGQLLFQFKRFPIKQIELVGSMIKDKNAPGLARMLGVFAIMGGASFFARQFFLDKEKQLRFRRMVDKQVGKGAGDMVMYGLPGYVGSDISGSLVLGDEPFGANIYEKAGRALAGPTLSIGLETARRIATAARKPVSTLDKAEAVMRSIPSLKPISELIRLESGNVDVLSPDGETKYRRQISDAIVGLGAFRSANEANKQLAVNAIIELKKETARLKNAYFVSKGGESEKKAIKDFNHRWPEIAILPSELSRYVTYRRGEFGKTEEQKVAGKKYRRILAR